MLTEPGGPRLTELFRRAVVLAVIASLQALIIYLMARELRARPSRPEAPVTEAAIIPIERRILDLPSFPPVKLQVSSPIDLPPLQAAIDVPVEQAAPAEQAAPVEQAPVTQGMDRRDSGNSQLAVAARAPREVDQDGAVRPQPISGPRGADRYPSASLKARESGKVVMNICVSPKGNVDSVELARSSGFPRLDQVALGIATEYRFHPATRHGHPVAACVDYYISFTVTSVGGS